MALRIFSRKLARRSAMLNAYCLHKRCNAVQLAREVRPAGLGGGPTLSVAVAGFRMTKAAQRRLDCGTVAKPETSSIQLELP